MATKVYIIDSNQAQYTAEELSGFINELMGEGVFDAEESNDDLRVLEATPNAMTVEVNPGACLIEYTKNGILWKVITKNNAIETLSITGNSSGSNRVDAVIMHLSQDEPNELKNNVAILEVVDGTGVAALTDGAIQSAVGDDNWYRIADVTVPNGASTITNSDIADTRLTVSFGKNDGGYVSRIRGDALTNPVSADIDFAGYEATNILNLEVNNNASFGNDVVISGSASVAGDLPVGGNGSYGGNLVVSGIISGDGSGLDNVRTGIGFDAGEVLTAKQIVKLSDYDYSGDYLLYGSSPLKVKQSLPNTVNPDFCMCYLNDTTVVIGTASGTSAIIRAYTIAVDGSLTLIDSFVVAGVYDTVEGIINCVRVSDTQAIFITNYGGVGNNIRYFAIELSGGLIAAGSVLTGSGYQFCFANNIDDGHALVMGQYEASSTTITARIYSVSGTTITTVTSVSLSNLTTQDRAVGVLASTDNSAFVVARSDGSTDDVNAIVVSVNLGTYAISESSQTQVSFVNLSDDCGIMSIIRNDAVEIYITALYTTTPVYYILKYTLVGTTLTHINTNTMSFNGTSNVYNFGLGTRTLFIAEQLYDVVTGESTSIVSNITIGGGNRYAKSTDGRTFALLSSTTDEIQIGQIDWLETIGVTDEAVAIGVSTIPAIAFDKLKGLSALTPRRQYYIDDDGDYTTDENSFPIFKSIDDESIVINDII